MENTGLSFQKRVPLEILMHVHIMKCKQEKGMHRAIKGLASLMQSLCALKDGQYKYTDCECKASEIAPHFQKFYTILCTHKLGEVTACVIQENQLRKVFNQPSLGCYLVRPIKH